VLNGRVASTRVRLNLKPYTPVGAVDIDEDGVVDRSAWVIMAAEETKALGDVLIDPYGNPAEDPIDIGKDVWYYSFDMFAPPIVDQGGMLNQPAVCSPWTVGASTTSATEYEFFPVQIDPLNGRVLPDRDRPPFRPDHQLGRWGGGLRERPVRHADLQAGHHQPGRPGRYLPAPGGHPRYL
jgi:hypothetical protein